MRAVINWAINNSPAMNTLLIAVMLIGAASLAMMRREIFPEFELEIVLVTVPYPGASPEDVEEGICQKIEERVQPIQGIKKQTSVSQEGAGFVILELDANVRDAQKVLNEVRSEIDQIKGKFPKDADEHEVKQITIRWPAIRIAVIGPDSDDPDAERALREVAEDVRDDLLQLQPAPPQNPIRRALSQAFPKPQRAAVSAVNILGAKPYQIDVQIPEETLREYGLSLKSVADKLRDQNVNVPGGRLKTAGQEVLLVGDNKRIVGSEIEQIEIVTQPSGEVLTVGDLGEVQDGFEDITMISRVDGKPGLVLAVDRTSDEDLLQLVSDVHRYLETKQMPAGYELKPWFDQSIDVRDRMEMLVRNGLQGLVLVFIVLAIFLELRLAFWVALGIPIAVLGAGGVLLYGGQTLNMLSMFAFLMALGIVVDDAIVIGENIFQHRTRGKSFVQAAIDGTCEVLPSVAASVCTTIIAFLPLMFVSGVMGKFIAVMPVAVIAMLIISLIESTFILPCHLAHKENLFMTCIGYLFYPLKFLLGWLRWLNQAASRLMEYLVKRLYLPAIRWSLQNPLIVLSSAGALLIIAVGFVKSGITPFVIFPKMDNRFVEAVITFPNGTSGDTVEAAVIKLEQGIEKVDQAYRKAHNKPLVVVRHRLVGQISSPTNGNPTGTTNGSHLGGLMVELIEPDQREMTSEEVLQSWRRFVLGVAATAAEETPADGQEVLNPPSSIFPGVDAVAFRSPSFGPAATPIEFKLLAKQGDDAALDDAVKECKRKLAEYDGVIDIEDDLQPGKWELKLTVKDDARSMGVSQAQLAQSVRSAYFGEEVMRLQRGRHEVKLMVRYPEQERQRISDLEDLEIPSAQGARRPLNELIRTTYKRGKSEVNRVNQLRSVTVSADVEEDRANAAKINADLRKNFMPDLLAKHPGVSVRWEGQEEQRRESMQSLMVGFVVAMLAMFVLLTVEFRSYWQPLLILAIIPFGAIGAIMGHALLGLELTLFSLFGLVALTGVVVNDSIVLIDFINKRLRSGVSLHDAVLAAGSRRFRAVVLTSITTIAGLLPLLMERSLQAQVLIPMATSLCFGLMLGTVLILILIPTFYYLCARLFLPSDRTSQPDSSSTTESTPTQPDQQELATVT